MGNSENRAGELIFLGLAVTGTFEHADSIQTPTTGKLFSPKKCEVVREGNNDRYTLFDTDLSCENNSIGLQVGYIPGTKLWTVSHILFLLSSSTTSTYRLICT